MDTLHRPFKLERNEVYELTTYNEFLLLSKAVECMNDANQSYVPPSAMEGFFLEFHHTYNANMKAISATVQELNDAIKSANASKIIAACDKGIKQCDTFYRLVKELPADKCVTFSNLLPFFVMAMTVAGIIATLGIKIPLPDSIQTASGISDKFAAMMISIGSADAKPGDVPVDQAFMQRFGIIKHFDPKKMKEVPGFFDYLGMFLAIFTSHNARGVRVLLAIPQFRNLFQQIGNICAETKYAKMIETKDLNDPNLGNRRYAATLAQIDDTRKLFLAVKQNAMKLASMVRVTKAEHSVANEAIIFSSEWRRQHLIKKAKRRVEEAEKQAQREARWKEQDAYDKVYDSDEIYALSKKCETEIQKSLGKVKAPAIQNENQLNQFVTRITVDTCKKAANTPQATAFFNLVTNIAKQYDVEFVADNSGTPLASGYKKRLEPQFEFYDRSYMNKAHKMIAIRLVNDQGPSIYDYCEDFLGLSGVGDAIVLHLGDVFDSISAVTRVDTDLGTEHWANVTVHYDPTQFASNKEATEAFFFSGKRAITNQLKKSDKKLQKIVDSHKSKLTPEQEDALFETEEHSGWEYIVHYRWSENGDIYKLDVALRESCNAKIAAMPVDPNEYDGRDLYNRIIVTAKKMLSIITSMPEFRQRDLAMQKICDKAEIIPGKYFDTSGRTMGTIAKLLKIKDSTYNRYYEGFSVCEDESEELISYYEVVQDMIAAAINHIYQKSDVECHGSRWGFIIFDKFPEDYSDSATESDTHWLI